MTTSFLLRRLVAIAAACVLAGAASACGSSAPTKKDVVAQANAICSSTLSKVRAVTPPPQGSTAASALSGYFGRLEPIVDKEVVQLRKLPRPDADKAVLNRYIVAVGDAGDTYHKLVTAARGNDVGAVAKYLSELRASPVQRLARQYGLSECVASAGTGSP